MLSPNMPLWHDDDFEPKAIEKQQIEKKLSTLPCLPKGRAYISLCEDVSPPLSRYRRGDGLSLEMAVKSA